MNGKKKLLATLLAGTFLASSLVGCGTKPVNGSSSADNSAPAAGGKSKVVMAVWSGNWADQLKKAEENFNKKHTDIELDIQMQSGDYSDFLGAKVASDDLPDIYIMTPYRQVQAFAKAGRLMDLSDMSFTDKIFATAKGAATYNDKIYGYPANVEYLGVFYNKALFKKAGIDKVPTTPDEFKTACEKLQAAKIQPIAPTFKESWTLKHLYSVLQSTMVQDNMTEWVKTLDSGKGTFKVDGYEQVFDFADIIRQNSGSKFMDADSTSGFNALANGQAAMLFSGEFSQMTVAEMESDRPDIGVFAVPVSKDASKNKLAVDVGIVYGVNAKTKAPDACKEVINFLSDEKDPEGYIAITTEKMGSAPPAMPYENLSKCSSSDDYSAYANSGNIIPWVYQQYTNGFDVISGDIFQAYIAGAKDRDTVLKELDTQYKDFIS